MDLNFQVNGIIHSISAVQKYKYLGVFFNDKLDWGDQIQHVLNKSRKGVAILYRLQFCADRFLRKAVYRCLVESHISYCIGVYGGYFPSKLLPVYNLQKKSLRFVRGRASRLSSGSLFRELELRSYLHLYIRSVLTHTSFALNSPQRPLHNHRTRFSDNENLLLPRRRTIRGGKTIMDDYIKFFNSLQLDQKNILANRHVITEHYFKKFVLGLLNSMSYEKLVEILQ